MNERERHEAFTREMDRLEREFGGGPPRAHAPTPRNTAPMRSNHRQSLAERQREAYDRAAREYSPLPDELGPIVPMTAALADIPASMIDAGLARFGDRDAAVRRDARTRRWQRGTDEVARDVVSDDHAGAALIDSVKAIPGAIRQAVEAERAASDRQTVGGGRAGRPSPIPAQHTPLDYVGPVARMLWMGWPEAGRDARGRVAASDVLTQEAEQSGDRLGAKMERRRGDDAAGDDFAITAPGALEPAFIATGQSLINAPVSVVRATTRGALRHARAPIPRFLEAPVREAIGPLTQEGRRGVQAGATISAATAGGAALADAHSDAPAAPIAGAVLGALGSRQLMRPGGAGGLERGGAIEGAAHAAQDAAPRGTLRDAQPDAIAGGSFRAALDIDMRDVVAALEHGAATEAEIAARTGLPQSSVADALRALSNDGRAHVGGTTRLRGRETHNTWQAGPAPAQLSRRGRPPANPGQGEAWLAENRAAGGPSIAQIAQREGLTFDQVEIRIRRAKQRLLRQGLPLPDVAPDVHTRGTMNRERLAPTFERDDAWMREHRAGTPVADIAARAGKSENTVIGGIFRAANRLSAQERIALAEELGVSPGYIRSTRGPRGQPPSAAAPSRAEQEAARAAEAQAAAEHAARAREWTPPVVDVAAREARDRRILEAVYAARGPNLSVRARPGGPDSLRQIAISLGLDPHLVAGVIRRKWARFVAEQSKGGGGVAEITMRPGADLPRRAGTIRDMQPDAITARPRPDMTPEDMAAEMGISVDTARQLLARDARAPEAAAAPAARIGADLSAVASESGRIRDVPILNGARSAQVIINPTPDEIARLAQASGGDVILGQSDAGLWAADGRVTHDMIAQGADDLTPYERARFGMDSPPATPENVSGAIRRLGGDVSPSPSARRPWTQEEVSRARSLNESGRTIREIGVELGRSPGDVSRRIRNGISDAPRRQANGGRAWTEAERARAQAMLESGMSVRDVGAELGRSPGNVAKNTNSVRPRRGQTVARNARSARQFDIGELVNELVARDEHGDLLQYSTVADNLGWDTTDSSVAVEVTNLRRAASAAIEGGESAVDALAQKWNVTPDRIHALNAIPIGQQRGYRHAVTARRLVASGVTEPEAIIRGMIDAAERALVDVPDRNTLKVLATNARRAAGLTRRQGGAGAAAIGATGAGGAYLLGADQADAGDGARGDSTDWLGMAGAGAAGAGALYSLVRGGRFLGDALAERAARRRILGAASEPEFRRELAAQSGRGEGEIRQGLANARAGRDPTAPVDRTELPPLPANQRRRLQRATDFHELASAFARTRRLAGETLARLAESMGVAVVRKGARLDRQATAANIILAATETTNAGRPTANALARRARLREMGLFANVEVGAADLPSRPGAPRAPGEIREILRKYGLAGLGVTGAGAAALGADDAQASNGEATPSAGLSPEALATILGGIGLGAVAAGRLRSGHTGPTLRDMARYPNGIIDTAARGGIRSDIDPRLIMGAGAIASAPVAMVGADALSDQLGENANIDQAEARTGALRGAVRRMNDAPPDAPWNYTQDAPSLLPEPTPEERRKAIERILSNARGITLADITEDDIRREADIIRRARMGLVTGRGEPGDAAFAGMR